MKKLKCFLCGAKYNPEKREKVAVIYNGYTAPESEKLLKPPEEPFYVSYLRIGGHVLRLCPACVKAAALGMVLTEFGDPNGRKWGEPIALEDDLSEEDIMEETND